jgi:hypothetical protein
MPLGALAFLTGDLTGKRRGPLAPEPPGGGPGGVIAAVWAGLRAARVADHYHSASEHGIIGRRIDTVVTDRFRRGRAPVGGVPLEPTALAVPRRPSVRGSARTIGTSGAQVRKEGDAGWRR